MHGESGEIDGMRRVHKALNVSTSGQNEIEKRERPNLESKRWICFNFYKRRQRYNLEQKVKTKSKHTCFCNITQRDNRINPSRPTRTQVHIHPIV